MAKKAGPGGAGATEVARITVRVSPDTSRFRRELRQQLQDLNRALQGDADVEFGADTEQMDRDVKKAAKKATAEASKDAKVKVEVETDKKETEKKVTQPAKKAAKAVKEAGRELDRFQKRSLSDLSNAMAQLEKLMTLDEVGESTRKQLEAAEKRLKNSIIMGPPKGASAKDAAAWRQMIQQQINEAKQAGIADEGIRKDPKKVVARRIKAINRLAQIRAKHEAAEREAAEEQRKRNEYIINRRIRAHKRLGQIQKVISDRENAAHKERLAQMAEELKKSKQLTDEHAAYMKQVTDWLKAEKAYEDERRARNLSDPFNARMLSELKKATAAAEKTLGTTADDERRREYLKSQFDRISRELEMDIPVNLELRAKQRDRIRKEIESIWPTALAAAAGGAVGSIGAINKKKDIFSKLGAPGFGSGINPSGYLLIISLIAAVTPLITGLMGAITTAVLTLPGLLAAVAAPIAAIALGLDGIKAAAARLAPQFEDLKSTMSAVVEEQFGPVFDKLGALFPTLKESLPGVSAGVAAVADSLADMLTSPENLERLKNIFSDIEKTIRDSAPGIRDFVDGLLELTKGLTGRLPDFAKWLNETGESFKTWVEDFTKKGPDGVSKFDHALDGLGFTLKELGGGIVELAGKALDYFSDPEKIKSFKAELDGLVNTILALMDAINGLATAFSKVPGFSDGEANSWFDFAPFQIQKGKQWIDGLLGSNTEEQGASSFSATWDGIKQKASEAANWVKEAWAPIGSFFSGIWSQVSAAATPVWSLISTAATTAWNVISSLWGGFASFMAGIFSGLGEALAPVWEPIKTGAQAAWAVIQGAFSGLGGWLSGVFSSAVSTVQGIWEGLKEVIATVCNSAIETITSWGSNIISTIQSIDLFSAGKALIQRLIDGIRSMAGPVIDAAKSVIGGIMNLIPHSPAKEGPFARPGWDALKSGGEAIGDQFGKGLENGFQPVIERAKELAGQVAGAFTSGSDPTVFLNGMDKGELQRLKKTLDLQMKLQQAEISSLNYQSKLNKDDEGLKRRLEELRQAKEQLGLQKEMIDLAGEYADIESENGSGGEDPLVKAASGLMKTPVDFAKATGKQFLSDIGISGDGLIGRALTEGIQYVFQIGSVDEAMSIKDRTESKAARAMMGR